MRITTLLCECMAVKVLSSLNLISEDKRHWKYLLVSISEKMSSLCLIFAQSLYLQTYAIHLRYTYTVYEQYAEIQFS